MSQNVPPPQRCIPLDQIIVGNPSLSFGSWLLFNGSRLAYFCYGLWTEGDPSGAVSAADHLSWCAGLHRLFP